MTEDDTFEHLRYTVRTDAFGTTFYYNDRGQLHREDGPAVIMKNGYRAWLLNGDYHREDGPARMWPDGSWQTFRYGVCTGHS